MHRRTRAAVLALGLTASVAAFVPTPASAGAPTSAHAVREVATGLENPRQLSFGAGDTLYVAEGGVGGAGPCFAGPEGGEVCFGETGAISRVDVNRRTNERVITGLPSLAAADGSAATGPSDVIVRGNNVSVLMGLGADPAIRATDPDLELFGQILTGRLGRGPLTPLIDISAIEAAENPDGGLLDSNPVGFLQFGRIYVVADAGANALVSADTRGSDVLAAFPSTTATPPAQSVPTDVERGPDGAYYVSELTGGPFVPGSARIWRVVPGRQPTVYATGLTMVTSLAFRGQTLYAVQLADAGLAGGPPVGSLRKVTRGGSTHEAVASGLFAPYGIAIRGNKAYVTTCSLCAAGGGVSEISLR